MAKTRKNKKNGGGWFSPLFGITYTNANVKRAASRDASYAIKELQGTYDKQSIENLGEAALIASPKYSSLKNRYNRLINNQKNIITKYRDYLNKIKSDIKIKSDREMANILKELKSIEDEQTYIKNKAILTMLDKKE